MTFPPSAVAWLYEVGVHPPHVAPSPHSVGRAVAALMRAVKAAGIRVVPSPAPEAPSLAAEEAPAAEADELLADEADAPPAPPAHRTNGEEFDVEGEAKRVYFEKLARATN